MSGSLDVTQGERMGGATSADAGRSAQAYGYPTFRFALIAGLMFFLATFLPVIRLQDGSIDTQALFFVVVSFMFIIRGTLSPLFSHPCGALSLILVAIIAYGLTISLMSPDSPSVHVALRPFRSLITLIGSVALVHMVYARVRKGSYCTFDLAGPMLIAIALHGAIMIGQFVSPEFRDAIYQYTVDPMAISGARYFYSMSGLSNGGGSQLSIFQSLGVLLLPVILSRKAMPLRIRILYSALALICMASVAITGRSGLLCVALFYPISCVMMQGVAKGMFQFLVHAGTSAALAWSVLLFVQGYSTNDEANFKERGMVDGIVAVATRANEEVVDQTTLKLLQEHFVVPESAFVLVFGDPRHAELSQNSEERELKSDIGYVRLLYSYGLIGLFLHCAFYGVIIAFAARFLRRGHENIKGVAVFCVVTSLVMFAFNAKEILFFSRMGLSVTCLSIAALAAFWRKEAMGVVSLQSPAQVEIRSPTPARMEGR